MPTPMSTPMSTTPTTYQSILRALADFWQKQGCAIHQGYDLEVGAGTFNPATFLRALGPEPYKAAYIEPSRRPADGRYGQNPVRMQHYFQFQVMLKPSPDNIQQLALDSLTAIGIDLSCHDVRFVHDDWESPTLGAWGLGWEVWLDGLEVLQFTYFQCCGGQNLSPITGEITYGTERLARYVQNRESSFDLQWNDHLTYGDIYLRSEEEWSHYNFTHASTEMWLRHFIDYEAEAKKLISLHLPLPAYDFVLKASHAFNILEARRFFSVTERAGYIARIRELARCIAEAYLKSREAQGFPLLAKQPPIAPLPTVPPLALDLQTARADLTETFLLEIGSEELPAAFVPIGMAGLRAKLEELLHREKIAYGAITLFGTPRRLGIEVKEIALGTVEEKSEKKGPPLKQLYHHDGMLTPAGEGFFRALGRTAPRYADILSDKAEGYALKEVKGESHLITFLTHPPRATAEILQEALPKLIAHMDFPKKMRWGSGDLTYARPIRWVVAMLGTHTIPFRLGTLVAGTTSQGHRQLAPHPIPLRHAEEYAQALREASVIAQPEERKKSILSQLDLLESSLNARALHREKVLAQVLYLTEFPTLTDAPFDKAFLAVPSEVLVSEMVEHQKYFPLASRDGTLSNLFVITADTNPTQAVRDGNQKVLSARLFDGSFLYRQDCEHTFEEWNERLKNVVYQQKLGSIYAKVERLMRHVHALYPFVAKELPVPMPLLERAAHICKADLASDMVGEFPELQGTMGRLYATFHQEDPLVATAIEEHWMPRGEKDTLPASSAGIVLSLADRLDTIVGCFLIGLIPTSSSDPHGLRRQMLGIVRMVLQRKLSIPLGELLSRIYDHFEDHHRDHDHHSDPMKKESVLQAVYAFMVQRIKTVFLEYAFRKDEIEASLSHHVVDLYDTFCRVEALHAFRLEDARFPLLVEVYKRAKGQVQEFLQQAKTSQASKSSESSESGESVLAPIAPIAPIAPHLLHHEAEQNLYRSLIRCEHVLDPLLEERLYRAGYVEIAKLQAPLSTFFESVKVLTEDAELRMNRVALLQQVLALFYRMLDLKKIQDKT